jgi:histidinol-phosphatase (PHP family)
VELAAHAVSLGLKEIGFSDHNPMPQDNFDESRMNASDLEAYVAKVHEARVKFPNLVIKLALEVDFIPGYEDWIRDLAGRHPWDYFIGAVHYVSESWALDSPTQLAEWKKRDPWEVWSVIDRPPCFRIGSFDIIAHADLQSSVFIEAGLHPLFSFPGRCKKHGLAMELNTAGLRKDCKGSIPTLKL